MHMWWKATWHQQGTVLNKLAEGDETREPQLYTMPSLAIQCGTPLTLKVKMLHLVKLQTPLPLSKGLYQLPLALNWMVLNQWGRSG